MRVPHLALLLAVTACGAPPPPPKPAPTGPPKPKPVPSLVPTKIDGQALSIEAALVESKSPHRAVVTLSTASIGCGAKAPTGDEKRVSITMVRELGGEGQWRMVRLGMVDGNREGVQTFPIAEAPKVGLPEKLVKKAEVTATFNAPVSIPDAPASRIEVTGPFEAEVCGASGDAPAPVEGDLKVEIGGEALVIAGATYRRGKKLRHFVALSTSPLECDADLEAADITMVLALDPIGRSVEAITVDGARLGESGGGEVDKGKVRSRILGGLGKIGVSLDGELEVSGLPVTFAGKVKATRCR